MFTEESHSTVRRSGWDDRDFDYGFVGALGEASYGGSAVGECVAVLQGLEQHDPGSWRKEWAKLAGQVESQGRAALARGHRVSAREAFMRATNYYRLAEYYGESGQLTQRKLGNRSASCFQKAARLLDTPVEVIAIPFEDRSLPGYFIRPSAYTRKRKTLVVAIGLYGTAEEMYFFCGVSALRRGYNVLLFDGPRHTGALRKYPDLVFRPDYEVPIKAAVDYLASRDDVDTQKLALLGVSLGGYFAIRAGVSEHRFAALIANPPMVDLYRYFSAIVKPERPKKNTRLPDVENMPDSELPESRKWSLRNIYRRFGVKNSEEWFNRLKEYCLEGAEREITCPSLSLVGEAEARECLRQAAEFYTHVPGPKRIHIFPATLGAETHCQVSNLNVLNQVAFDWLDECLDWQHGSSNRQAAT